MNQEIFNELIKKCIDDKNIEKALQLYLENEKLNPFLIEEYIIKIKSSFYACELISIGERNLDVDSFIDMIIKTGDITFIGEVALNNLISTELSYENTVKLRKACEKDK